MLYNYWQYNKNINISEILHPLLFDKVQLRTLDNTFYEVTVWL